MTIDFKTHRDRLFTPVYFKVHEAITRYVVVFGGAASSKSYSVHQHELLLIMNPGLGDTLVMRKSAADIRESCFKLFQFFITKYGLAELFTQVYSNDQRKITCKHTGRSLIFKGIDEPEKLKSIVGIQRVVMEEASQFEFEDFLELNRRLRGIEDLQTVLILNPISENHWIKTKMCDVGSPYYDDTTILKFTYRDNCNLLGESNLTAGDIKELERLKEINENQYRIYVEGEWGIDNKEAKFCWSFEMSQVKKTMRDETRILWVTFDFNINPLTCTVAQILPEDKTLRAIECFKLENSDIWQMCARLKATYPDAMWMVTGDATGQNRSAMVADNMNYFMIIQQAMGLSDQQLDVPSVNPRIEENRLLVNAVHKNWTVEIDPDKCAPLIYDLQYVEVDRTGHIIKGENRNGSNSDKNKRKFADFLDNWRYLINVGVAQYFNWRN